MSTHRAAVQEDATRRLVNLISDDVRTACQPATRLVHGKSYEQILAVAEELRSDLIVLGVHGRKAFDMMMFGSTTNQVHSPRDLPGADAQERRSVARRRSWQSRK